MAELVEQAGWSPQSWFDELIRRRDLPGQQRRAWFEEQICLMRARYPFLCERLQSASALSQIPGKVR